MQGIVRTLPVLALVGLTGCASTGAEPPATPGTSAARCVAGGLDAYVGRKASAETGAELLAKSGARTLRWAPPRSAVTMDFREDRLTVAYDDDMIITSVRCG